MWPPLACRVPVCRGFRAAGLTRCLCPVRRGRAPSSAVSSPVSQQGWGSLTPCSGFQAVTTLGCFSAFPAGSSARPRQLAGSGQRWPLEDFCVGAAPVGRLGLRVPWEGDPSAGIRASGQSWVTSELAPSATRPQFLERQQSRALCAKTGNYHRVIIIKIIDRL